MLTVVDDARVAASAGVLRGTGHQTIVLGDGRIKLAGGEPSTSLSKAAAYARGTQSANGWGIRSTDGAVSHRG